jgi:hypothetical protein
VSRLAALARRLARAEAALPPEPPPAPDREAARFASALACVLIEADARDMERARAAFERERKITPYPTTKGPRLDAVLARGGAREVWTAALWSILAEDEDDALLAQWWSRVHGMWKEGADVRRWIDGE